MIEIVKALVCFVQVRSDFKNGRLLFNFELDSEDRAHIANSEIKINEGIEIYVELGPEIKKLHPDQIALASILICNPFVGKELRLSNPVSKEFFNSVSGVISRYKIKDNCSEEIESLSKSNHKIPALAFSGGADSTAALAIMPSDTIPIFLNRPEMGNSLYDSDAPLEICRSLKESGYEVHVIDSNLELIREPLGFPTDLAHAVPIILLGNQLGIGSISFGTIMESGYGIGHEKYHDYRLSAHNRFYSTLFQSVGIDLAMPVIGISEVGTAIICNKSPFGFFSQSCIRGTWLRPCMSCWKCFRKELLAISLGNNDADHLISIMETSEVQMRLSAYPISHENVIIYALQKLSLDDHPYLKSVAAKLDMGTSLSFLEAWYPPSIDLVPDGMRHGVRDKILSFLRVMSPVEEGDFFSWNMEKHLESARAKKAQENLTSSWQDFTSKFAK